MLSLKKAIDGFGREEERLLRDCLLDTVKAVQENVVDVNPDLTDTFRAQMLSLYQELAQMQGTANIENSQALFTSTLERYCARANEFLATREDDLRGIVQLLGTAAETLLINNDSHSAKLKTFAGQLQAVSKGTDIGKIRFALLNSVEDLRTATDFMWRENQASVEQMQEQLREFQMRLEKAESLAAIDSLTGLTSRGEGETRLRQALAAGGPVSVILIDLNGFKLVNDRWGHSAGDQVLKAFASTLSRSIRPGDCVCRWGGDEFLITLPGNEELAKRRAEQLAKKLKSSHKLVILGQIVTADVSAALGVAQARAGEPMEDLLTRADVDLYNHKAPSSRRSADGLHSKHETSEQELANRKLYFS